MAHSIPSASTLSPTSSSFPSPLPPSSTQQAPSITSSRLTDVASDDGEEFRYEQSRSKRPQTAASNDANRPGSAMSSTTRPSTRATTSRRGLPSPTSPGNWRMGGAFFGPGTSATASSRPESSASKTSRTHVPSLASHAFFRPMSSQRLQAQRGVTSPRSRPRLGSSDAETETETNRHSIITSTTDQLELPIQSGLSSRGTNTPENEDKTVVHIRSTEDAIKHSRGESERALHYGQYSPTLSRGDDTHYIKPVKTTRTLNTTFLRNSSSAQRESQGHERLSSSNNSPVLMKPQRSLKSEDGKNYQFFPGNTFFCFSGRLQNTRSRPVNIASGLIVVLPAILFFVYSAPYLFHHVSPAAPILFAYLFCICVSSFIHASVTDPGIMPRNVHPLPPPELSDDPLTLGPPTTQWTMIKSEGTANAAMDVPTKYCKTCNIWRPPRCHHCRICDNCIESLDHHCVWINNCVGRRNYRYFFGFVSTGTLLGLYLIFGSLGHCLKYASDHNLSFRGSIEHNHVPFAMIIYGILAVPYPACLWAYHLWLMARGETTREYITSHKFLKKDRHRPFNRGNMIKNWAIVLLKPRTPTYVRFKERHEEGDQRFGSRRGKLQAPAPSDREGRGVELQNMRNEMIKPR